MEAWLTTIEAAFAEDEEDDGRDKSKREAEKRKAREHRIVPALIPDYLEALDAAESRRADLDAQVKVLTAKPEDDDPDEDASGETPDPAELRQLRSDLAAAKSTLRRLEKDFLNCLQVAVAVLGGNSTESLVLDVLRSDLQDRFHADIAAGRRALIDRYRTWADKYAITRTLERSRDEAAARLNSYLKDLGYE